MTTLNILKFQSVSSYTPPLDTPIHNIPYSFSLTSDGSGFASLSLDKSNLSSFQLPMSVLCEYPLSFVVVRQPNC